MESFAAQRLKDMLPASLHAQVRLHFQPSELTTGEDILWCWAPPLAMPWLLGTGGRTIKALRLYLRACARARQWRTVDLRVRDLAEPEIAIPASAQPLTAF